MQCKVNSLALVSAINLARRGCGKADLIPILPNVLMRAVASNRENSPGELWLTGTNLAMAITVRVPAEVGDEDWHTVPALVLAQYAATLPEVSVGIELDETSAVVHMTAGTHRTRLHGITAAEFPTLPQHDGEDPVFEVDAAEFARAIGQVAGAASDDASNPVLTGVLIRCSGTRVTLAATNGHWLGERILQTDGPAQTFEAIVPARHLREVARAVDESRKRIRVMVGAVAGVGLASGDARHLIFDVGDDVEVSSRIIEGSFPAYRNVIPSSFTTHVTVPAAGFQRTLRTTAVLALDGSTTVRLLAAPPTQEGETGLDLWALTPERGSDVTIVPGAEMHGDVVDTFLSGKYLGAVLDALVAAAEEQAELTFTTPESPVMITPGGDRDDLTYVVMPIRAPTTEKWGRKGL